MDEMPGDLKGDRMKNKLPDLSKMTPEQLEIEANKLLYGSGGVPKRIMGTQYRLPKQRAWYAICVDCGRPRSTTSGQRCQSCYKKRVKRPEHEGVDAAAFERLTDVGTEISDDGIVSTTQITRPKEE